MKQALSTVARMQRARSEMIVAPDPRIHAECHTQPNTNFKNSGYLSQRHSHTASRAMKIGRAT